MGCAAVWGVVRKGVMLVMAVVVMVMVMVGWWLAQLLYHSQLHVSAAAVHPVNSPTR